MIQVTQQRAVRFFTVKSPVHLILERFHDNSASPAEI